MPTARLTDAAVKRFKTPTDVDRIEYWDTATSGFGIRISASGVRSWVMILRILKDGRWQQQRLTLGRYPGVSLAEARAKAIHARGQAEQGGNPGAAIRCTRESKVDASRNTFAAVRDEFLAKYRGRRNRKPAVRTMAEIKRILNTDLFAEWIDKPLVQITRRDILAVLDTLVERGAEVMANRTLAYLSMLFGWALERDIITADPTDRIKKPGAESSRERVLSLDELKAIWLATTPTQANKCDLFAPIVKLLMLTGQRRNEVAGMRWSEIDFDQSQWNLPGDRTKNHLDHIIPLSSAVIEILIERKAEQTAMRMHTPLVFTSTGRTHFSGWSRSKARLDGRADIDPWTLHDLRRTLATRMAEDLRIAPHVIEAVLNHVSGSRSGVAGVYNRALYLNERKKALDAWAEYVLRLSTSSE